MLWDQVRKELSALDKRLKIIEDKLGIKESGSSQVPTQPAQAPRPTQTFGMGIESVQQPKAGVTTTLFAKPQPVIAPSPDDVIETATREVFEKAGVIMTAGLHDEIYAILASKMAALSVSEGLTWRRVDKFNEQKKALVQDLKDGIASGQVRAKPAEVPLDPKYMAPQKLPWSSQSEMPYSSAPPTPLDTQDIPAAEKDLKPAAEKVTRGRPKKKKDVATQ